MTANRSVPHPGPRPAPARAPLARVTVGPSDGPTLVLLHGITGSAISQADALIHWARLGYRVVALDARGHGLSSRWDEAALADPGEQLVSDVIAELEALAQEGELRARAGLPAGRTPVLIGQSMGAATAAVVAGRRPELVSGVVLEDPARFGRRTPEDLLRRGAARQRAREADLRDLPAAVGRAVGAAADETLPECEAVVSVWASQRTDPALLGTGVVTPEVPWDEAMAALRVPTLLITGDEPGSARVGRDGLEKAVRNPAIEGVLVPGAGHQVRRTRPEGFYGAVDRWLERVTA